MASIQTFPEGIANNYSQKNSPLASVAGDHANFVPRSKDRKGKQFFCATDLRPAPVEGTSWQISEIGGLSDLSLSGP
jgi:hypothetical protein